MSDRAIERLAEEPLAGWRLAGVRWDLDGLTLSFHDPEALQHGPWHQRGARHVHLSDWAWVGAMRPSFSAIARIEVVDDDDWVLQTLSRLPEDWFPERERAKLRGVRLYDEELDAPVLEIIAPSYVVTESPLREP